MKIGDWGSEMVIGGSSGWRVQVQAGVSVCQCVSASVRSVCDRRTPIR
jgi:hypothetical protein